MIAAPWDPTEPPLQPWRVVSFASDARLAGCNVFQIDFERSAQSPHLQKIWLATSDGLRESDGIEWRRHGTEHGLPSTFVRSVLVTRDGQLWVGTDRGAGIYDGRSFRTFGSETNLAGPSVRRMAEDMDGTIWFCSDPWPSSAPTGGLTSFRQGQWRAYGVEDGLPGEYVVNYFRDASNRQWVVTKNGLAHWDGGRWVTDLAPGPDGESFASGGLAEVPGKPLLFSAGINLFVLTNGTWTRQPDARAHPHGICATADGRILASQTTTLKKKALAEWTGPGWSPVSAEFELPRGYSEDIREDPDGNVWVVGYETLICWRRQAQWQVYRDLPPAKLIDQSGRVWFGWDQWGTQPPAKPVRLAAGRWDALESPVDDLLADPAGTVWGWSSNHVTRWLNGGETRFTEADTGVHVIRLGRPAANGRYWLAGYDVAGRMAVSTLADDGDQGARWSVHRLPGVEGEIRKLAAAASAGGIWFIVQRSAATDALALHVTTNAVQQIPIPRRFLSEFRYGLHVSADDSTVWLYGDNGLYRTRSTGGSWEAITNLPGRSVIGIVERGSELWVGCNGATGGTAGLARLRGGEWKAFPAPAVSSLSLAGDQSVLAGGHGRFLRVENQPDAIPLETALPEDIPVDAVVMDREGAFWAGQAGRMFRFKPDGIPPATQLFAQGTNLLRGETFTVTATALERFRPTGRRHDFAFSWRKDGGPWTPFQREAVRSLSTTELASGMHTIEVRARDAAGEIDSTPATFHFRVHPVPLQSQPWFSSAALGVCALLGLLAFVAVRARAELATYARTLEHKVAERTTALEADLHARRRAEDALRESEERLMTTLDSLLEGCQVIGFDWRYLYVNRKAAEQGRRLRDEMIGRRMMDIYPGLEQTPLFTRLQRCLQERTGEHFENTFTYPDGSSANFNLEIRPVPDGIFVHSIDVTARRQAEEARERLVQLIEHSADFIATADLAGHLTYLNPAGRSLIGFGETAELAELSFTDYVAPAWREVFTETVVPALRESGHWEGEMQWSHLRTGAVIEVALSTSQLRHAQTGEPLGFATVTRDITARKAADQAFRDSEERFRQLAENIREVFWLTDTARRQILYVSPAYERIWGRSTASLHQSPSSWHEAIHAEDRSRVLDAIQRNQADGSYDLEYRIMRPDGETRWIHDRAFPVRNAAGELYRIAGIADDITARRQLEAQFRQAQKMEALGTLSGGIAHDFNNILGAIFGNVHLARMDLEPGHPMTQSIAQIEKAALRAKALVRQILAFSRQQPQAREIISLAPVIEEAASLLRASLPAEVELIQTARADAPHVFADASQVHQILLNLCTNAWHALEGASGRIEIQLRPVRIERDESNRVPGLHRGLYACLSVSDNGQGMDAPTLDRIFEPFFTTKAQGQGTGLGLAVVHGIMQSHDGAIQVVSQPGRGTTFNLYFPAIEANLEASLDPGRPLRPGSGQRILYLDDEAPLVDLSVRMLQRLAYRPEGFTHPDQALAAFRANPAQYDLVITDLHMSGMSGLEFIQAVRRVQPDTRVILSSGHMTDDVVSRARALGVAHLLHKPNSLEDFSDALQQVLFSRPQRLGAPHGSARP